MTGSWKFVSETWETISLHDHCITSVEEIGTDLILHFTDDGFDVTKDNPLNPTGRHRNAGLAGFIMLELYAQRVLFCWNDLPRDAWFQEQPKKQIGCVTMDEIKWLEVAVNTTPDRLDQVCAKLAAAGMDSVVIEDEQDFLSFLEQNRQYWDYVDQELLDRMKGVTRVKFYVTDDADGRAQLKQYTRGLETEYTTVPLTDNDWAYSWQKYYKPLEIGKRLYVVPQWMREEPVPAGRVPFYLNPGLTFGTGSHASTQLCLEGVEAHTVPGRTVLDLGCGSGILSIAALCLGASSAVAVDIDPKAVDVAYENAALNGIGRDRYTVRAGNVLADTALAAELAQEKYHLVLANIVADVIIPLAPQVPGLLEEDGVFLCSGIIDTRTQEVEAALKQAGLTLIRKREKNGWAALEAKR